MIEYVDSMNWRFISKIIVFYKQAKTHFLFPILTFVTGWWFSMWIAKWTTNPIFGAIGIAATIYLTVVILLSSNSYFRNKSKAYRFCINCFIPAIICIAVVWPFWDKLIAIFPSNSNENIFINHTIRKNIVSSTHPYKYELLVEFGARYYESNGVDLEINTGNAHENIEVWWDKPHLKQKSPSFVDINQPVITDYGGGTSQAVVYTHIISQDITKPPIYKLKLGRSYIVPEKRSFYLLFQGNKPLKLKSAKFEGKNFFIK